MIFGKLLISQISVFIAAYGHLSLYRVPDALKKVKSQILSEFCANNRLKRLEDEKIVTKTLDSDNQKKFIYELTQKGLDLIPAILEVIVWGAKYDANTSAPKEFIKKIKKRQRSSDSRVTSKTQEKKLINSKSLVARGI